MSDDVKMFIAIAITIVVMFFSFHVFIEETSSPPPALPSTNEPVQEVDIQDILNGLERMTELERANQSTLIGNEPTEVKIKGKVREIEETNTDLSLSIYGENRDVYLTFKVTLNNENKDILLGFKRDDDIGVSGVVKLFKPTPSIGGAENDNAPLAQVSIRKFKVF